MDSSLMQDLIKFREMLNDKQRYLENCSHMRKPNDELEATLAKTVEEIKVQLDGLIAKHLITCKEPVVPIYTPYMWRLLDKESLRKTSRRLFANA